MLLIFLPAEVVVWMKVTQTVSELHFTASRKFWLRRLFREILYFRYSLGPKLSRSVRVRMKIFNSNYGLSSEFLK